MRYTFDRREVVVKAFALVLFLGFCFSVFAEPTVSQFAVIAKYDGITFPVTGLKAGKGQTNGWIPYAWTEGRTVWDNASLGFSAVVEPSRTEIYRYSATEYEYHFTDGRIVKSDPTTGKKSWNPLVGDPAPDFDLATIDGKSRVKLSSLKGTVVFLDFWASWCGPCQTALPGTEALYQRFRSKGLKVLGINIEGDAAAARKNASQLKLTFPTLLAQNGPGGANWNSLQIADYGINSIPRGVLIDKKGIIRAEDTIVDAAPVIEKLLVE